MNPQQNQSPSNAVSIFLEIIQAVLEFLLELIK